MANRTTVDQEFQVPRMTGWAFAVAPISLTRIVWIAGLLAYTTFAFRLIFTTTIARGLPGQDAYPWLEILVAAFVVAGWMWSGRLLVIFLASLPSLALLNALGLVTVWEFPQLIFASWAIGSTLRIVLVPSCTTYEPTWVDLAIGIYFLCVNLSAILAAVTPSLINACSIAFAIPQWSDKTEFNFFQNIHSVAGGCLIYLVLARECRIAGGRLVNWMSSAIAIQFYSTLAFSILGVLLAVANTHTLAKTSAFLPFGWVQPLAGPACLFAGYFAGLAMRPSPWTVRRWFEVVTAVLAVILVIISTSKIAYFAVAGLVVAVLFVKSGKTVTVMLLILLIGIGVIGVRSYSSCAPDYPVVGDVALMLDAKRLMQHSSTTVRLDLWTAGMKMSAMYPLSGLGLGSYSSTLDRFSVGSYWGRLDWSAYSKPPQLDGSKELPRNVDTFNSYYAHNDFLELSSSAGLPVTLLFIVIILLAMSTGVYSATLFQSAPLNRLAPASAIALLVFVPNMLFDSRILYFENSMFLWQFLTLCLCVPAIKPAQKARWFSLLPLVAIPVIMVGGASFDFWQNRFPGGRTFGVWNWRMQDGKGNFMLAREAQFWLTPEDKTTGLEFLLPDDSKERVEVGVSLDGTAVGVGFAEIGRPYHVILSERRVPGSWQLVKVESSKWAGRGFLGSPLGVKPYSVVMRKISNEGSNQEVLKVGPVEDSDSAGETSRKQVP